MKKPSIIISAGGTGGHIFPALAVAQELRNDYTIFWVGSKIGMEQQIIPKSGYPLFSVAMGGIRHKGWLRKILLPFTMLRAMGQCLLILRQVRPIAVCGFGGYAAFPICLSARLWGCAMLIHEQNSVAGLSNKVLAYLAHKVLTAFPNTLVGPKTLLVGNPVRKEIIQLKHQQADSNNKLRILVLGGSLGARALNQQVPQALVLITGRIAAVTHQVGRGDLDQVTRLYQEALTTAERSAGSSLNHSSGEPLVAEVVSFIDNMAEAYANADLVICRSGASTVAEVSCAGLMAIFVPYPYAVDDHQTANANYLVAGGAALLLPESQLNAASLAQLISGLTVEHCRRVGKKAAALAITNSTELIAEQIRSAIEDRR